MKILKPSPLTPARVSSKPLRINQTSTVPTIKQGSPVRSLAPGQAPVGMTQPAAGTGTLTHRQRSSSACGCADADSAVLSNTKPTSAKAGAQSPPKNRANTLANTPGVRRMKRLISRLALPRKPVPPIVTIGRTLTIEDTEAEPPEPPEPLTESVHGQPVRWRVPNPCWSWPIVAEFPGAGGPPPGVLIGLVRPFPPVFPAENADELRSLLGQCAPAVAGRAIAQVPDAWPTTTAPDIDLLMRRFAPNEFVGPANLYFTKPPDALKFRFHGAEFGRAYRLRISGRLRADVPTSTRISFSVLGVRRVALAADGVDFIYGRGRLYHTNFQEGYELSHLGDNCGGFMQCIAGYVPLIGGSPCSSSTIRHVGITNPQNEDPTSGIAGAAAAWILGVPWAAEFIDAGWSPQYRDVQFQACEPQDQARPGVDIPWIIRRLGAPPIPASPDRTFSAEAIIPAANTPFLDFDPPSPRVDDYHGFIVHVFFDGLPPGPSSMAGDHLAFVQVQVDPLLRAGDLHIPGREDRF